MKKIGEIIPGFLICVLIAIIGKDIAVVFPSLGAATFAIGLGIIGGNTIFNYNLLNKLMINSIRKVFIKSYIHICLIQNSLRELFNLKALFCVYG